MFALRVFPTSHTYVDMCRAQSHPTKKYSTSSKALLASMALSSGGLALESSIKLSLRTMRLPECSCEYA